MAARRYIPLAIFIVLLAVVQITVSLAGANYYLTQLTMSLYYALIAVGLCLFMGYAGQVSMGHAGFFGIGAYVQAVVTTSNLLPFKDAGAVRFLDSIGFLIHGKTTLGQPVLYVSPWLALLFALLITVGIAFLIGVPVLKLKGHYLAMATLGFNVIVLTLVLGVKPFGGADGLSGVPPFALVPGVAVSGRFDARVGNYYIAAVLLILGIVVAMNLVRSRVGRALRAIHGNESAAGSLGINTSRYKLYTFVLSAVFAALGGCFLAHYNAAIGPSDIDIMKSVRFVAIVAVGGMDSIWGVVYSGIILTFISLRQVFQSYDEIFFALILIVVMLFSPRGFFRYEYVKNALGKLRARLRKERAG
ncbi:MAG: branched-chain amino acid ABC transporter permease [Spirochaetales bacterium]|nr:branched-chain amino acid ABC transporter permease [Spirochaetales bacterium]